MFRILLLLALASCAKLNFKTIDKSGKRSESSRPNGFDTKGQEWKDVKETFALVRSNNSHSSDNFSSSSSKNSGRK